MTKRFEIDIPKKLDLGSVIRMNGKNYEIITMPLLDKGNIIEGIIIDLIENKGGKEQ